VAEEIRCKIYVSDEGYGPLVRQRAILAALRQIHPGISAQCQTKHMADAARRILPATEVVERFNNISWAKHPDGTPDIQKIRAFYCDYLSRSNRFMATESGLEDLDFVISDFCYEAFPVASRFNLPAFGVCHFTWDWFFSRLYPVPVATEVLDRWRTYAESADAIYFPPFTPRDIVRSYRSKAVEVPFIVSGPSRSVEIADTARRRVLIMDSGGGVLTEAIRKALLQASALTEFEFFVPDRYGIKGENLTLIEKDELLLNYMPHMDFVIARAGFNTISECVAARVPLLLIGEASNPEMEMNMLFVKQEGIGSFISLQNFSDRLVPTIRAFDESELGGIRRRLRDHDYATNGAAVIAEDILSRLR
jgi:hypothetical protein